MTNWKSSDCIVTIGKPKNRSSISGRPDLLLGPHSLVCIGTRNSFLEGKAARLMKLNTHLYHLLRLRISGATLPLLHMRFCFALGQEYLYITPWP